MAGKLSGIIGGGKAPADKAKDTSKKAPAAKKAAAPKAKKEPKEGGVVRTASTVSKEGTQKCAFSGEVLPVTSFPTMKDKDGNTVRGPVARKHLEASRAANKAKREAAKAEAEKAKAAKAKDKAAAKPAEADAEG